MKPGRKVWLSDSLYLTRLHGQWMFFGTCGLKRSDKRAVSMLHLSDQQALQVAKTLSAAGIKRPSGKKVKEESR